MRVLRAYVAAEAPYREPWPESMGPLSVHVDTRHLASRRAQQDLRRMVAAGGVPAAVDLIAPCAGVRAGIAPGGRVHGVYAWELDGWGRHEQHGWFLTNGGAYVLAVIDADAGDIEPDADEFWRAAGSCLVRSGRITGFWVSSLLAPVAPLLAARYGLPVQVAASPWAPFVVTEAAPVMAPSVLPARQCAMLRAHLDQHPGEAAVDVPAGLSAPLLDLARHLGGRLGLPVSSVCPLAVGRYGQGVAVPWRTDLDPADSVTFTRTVSLVLLLSDPGTDFEGGTLSTSHGPVALRQGDAVAFTAQTRYQVEAVTSGARYVVLGYGAWDGWDSGEVTG